MEVLEASWEGLKSQLRWPQIQLGGPLSKLLSFEKKLPHPANSVCLLMHVTSERIELEGPGWSSGWSSFEFSEKPDQLGLSSSIRLEATCIR